MIDVGMSTGTLSRKNVRKKGAYYIPESDQLDEIEKKKKVVPKHVCRKKKKKSKKKVPRYSVPWLVSPEPYPVNY